MNREAPPRRSSEGPELWDEVKSTLGSGWRVVLNLLIEGLPSSSEVREQASSFPRVWALTRRCRGQLAVALLAVLVTALLVLTGPVVWRYLVDSVTPGGDGRLLGRITLLLIGLYVLRGGMSLLSGYLLRSVALRVMMDLRLRLFEHLHCLSLAFYGRRRTGELVSRVMSDVRAVQGMISGDISGALAQTVVFFGALGMLLMTDWRLTILMFLLIPAVSLVSVILGRILRSLSSLTTDELARVTTVLEESISSVRTVRAFGREPYETARFRSGLGRLLEVAVKQMYLDVLVSPLMMTLFFSTTVVIVWYGGQGVIAGRLTTGQLVQFLSLTSIMGGAIRWFGDLWTRLQSTLGALDRLFALLDEVPDLVELPGALDLPPIAGRLTLENVSFAYSGGRSGAGEQNALNDISLEVAPGEILAVVGPSGAGKTTLANLVMRLYDPTAGRILFDSVDIRAVTLSSLRAQTALVPQETQLFGGTIRENILYGKLDATEEELLAAAEAAHAHGFVERLEDGYGTLVGERGIRLSGGQRQRIAIARALLKNPRLLLLDEATSALDTVSESLVHEALDRLMVGRTTLIIAHRLSTIQSAHRIAVLDEGQLVELGTHTELIASGGLYARLYQRLTTVETAPADASDFEVVGKQ